MKLLARHALASVIRVSTKSKYCFQDTLNTFCSHGLDVEVNTHFFSSLPPEVHSEPCHTSKMKRFTNTVNGFKPITIFAKCSILGV